MSNMDKLAKELKNQMTASNDRKPKPYDTQAEVVKVDGNTAWVHIPGGVDSTPAQMTINAKKGDMVHVRVANGTAWLTGNSTSPPTDDAKTNELAVQTKQSIDFVKELADKDISVNSITATTGYIEHLKANDITAESITSDHAIIGALDATYATIETLEADYATIDELHSNYATIETLEADYATIDELHSDYAEIDLANVNNAWIEHGAMKKAEVFDENVFDLSGDHATIRRIDASKINVANLRADNLVVRRINGQPVVGGYTLIDSNSPGYSSKNPQALGWYEFVNAQWVLSTDTTVDMTKAYYQTGNEVSLYDQAYIDGLEDDLQQQIDGAVETFTGSVVPTLVNWPYTDWYDTSVTPVHDERAKHVGDIYYVVNSASDENGYCYRFAYDNTSHAYSWVLIKDSDVTKALSDISDLQTFESTTTSWMDETDEGIETIRTNHTALSGLVDKTVKESVQLWFTKANTTAPNKPTAEVTSTSTAGNAWRKVVPAYNASYPNYYYCWQYKFVDGTFGWSDVVRDIAMGETQGTSRDAKNKADAALPASTFESFESTTFTDLVDEVDEQSTTMTNMTTRLGLNSDGTGANTDIVAKESALEQTVDGISTRVGKTETKLIGMYATSSTAKGARDKVATITPALPSDAPWELGTGTMVTVKFVNANTYAATSSSPLRLNVNGKGLKPIKTYANGDLSEAEYKWAAGSTFTFVYNGTNWLMQDSSVSVRMNSAETSITQNAEQIQSKASQSSVDSLSGRVSAAESTITQQATAIEAKVSKDGVIASINASVEEQGGSAVKISADKVNIEGAAIFTGNGRLSSTSLDNAYDSKGSASTAESNAKSYTDTATSDMATNTSVASTYATKAAANAQEQLIYKSAVSGTASMSGTTTWITSTSDAQNAWTTKRPTYSSSYPVLFVATQRKSVGGTVTCTTPVKDDTTTVIDGGHITTGTIDADIISSTVVNAINANVSDTINGNKINASEINIGSLAGNIGGRNLLKGTSDITVVPYASATDEYGLYYKSGTGTLTSHVVEANSRPFPIPTGTCLKITTTEANKTIGISQKKQVRKETYCFSAWVKGTAGDTVRLGTIFSGTSGIAESQKYTDFTIADGDWHKYEIVFTPKYDHIGDTDCRAPYVLVKSATVGRNFYVCGIQLEYGNKSTDWTPAPEDDGGGANLVPYPYYRSYASGNPWTENGITWTVNADGSVTATGTATATTSFLFTNTNNTVNPNGIYWMPAGGYVLSGSPTNGTGSTARLVALFQADTSGTSTTDLEGNSSEVTTGGFCKSFRLEVPTCVRIYAQILSGTTCPEGGYTFYPMLEKGSLVHSFVSPNVSAGAASTATKFITKINDAGIFISPANQNPTTSAAGNSTKITADGMTVYKGGADVSFFGDSVRIGKSDNNRVEIGSTASDAYVNVYSPNTNGGLYCNQNIYAEKNVSAGASVVADTAVHSKGSLTVDGVSVFNGSSNELKGTTSFFKGVNIYKVASDPTIGVFCSQPVTVENNLYCQHLDMPNNSALRAKDTGGTLRNLLYLNNSNQYIYGNTTYPTRIYGQTLWMSSQPTYGSDKRLKRNIKELSSDSDELILNIKPVQYEWDDSYEGYSKGINLGFIAQDVEEQMKSLGMSPDAYHLIQQPQSGDAYFSLSYTEFIPMLTHLVQSQQKEIDLLKEEIRQLKSEV